MTIPEIIWELGIGIYLIAKGYRTRLRHLRGRTRPYSAWGPTRALTGRGPTSS